MAKVITIASGKGGVGKTVTAINLAVALNSLGKNVVLVDSNLTTPNVAIHLGSPVVPVTLNHVLQGKKHIYSAVYEHHSGTKVVPSSLALEQLKGIKPQLFGKAIEKLKKLSDFIIIDSAAGLGREALLAIEALDENDELLIVTNPEMPAVADALKTIKLAERLGKKVSGVIITRAKNKKNQELSTKNIKALMEKPILARVPEDDSVKESIMQRSPVVLTHPKSKAAKSYKRLAAKIANVEYKEENKSFFEKLFGWLR
ncbi:MAG: cell division ATPase MinD [Candidatus Pacearchaeota archaeon]|nr:cell division ATPase MinD [Candidatus Pacearchaeota archaeon]